MKTDSRTRGRARILAEVALLRFWPAFVRATVRERKPGGILHGLPPGRLKGRGLRPADEAA